jgi:response regulator RpfG family c-di-GMP phosphodiesterase
MNPSDLEKPQSTPDLNLERKETNSKEMNSNDMRSILFIDNGHRDRRRERNSVLSNAGYRVHPARSFEQSLSRIGSGAYDLVIASTDGAAESAQQFIQDVKRNFPRQKMLVMKTSGIDIPSEFESSTADPKMLLERVHSLLRPQLDEQQPMAA